jgi:Fe-only nitrogenase accessory protein AnfO
MPHDIAVFLDKEGKTTCLTEQGRITVFTRKQGKWNLSREKEFTLQDVQGMTDFRVKMEELLEFLAECKILVGLKINGIPSVLLDKAKCKIWEYEGEPLEFLDTILKLEEEVLVCSNDDTQDQAIEKPFFIEISPGNYYVSVKEIQENNNRITTKQVLQPFMRQGQFHTLEIICNHVPQWLEGVVLTGSYAMQISKQEEDLVKVVLSKK